MTPEAAIYNFLNGFGIPAYPTTSTPSDAQFPYFTYDLVVGDWEDGEINMAVNLWERTESEARPNQIVRELAIGIGKGGITINCDNGIVWIKKGSPWAQAMRGDSADEKIKQRYINIDIEYLTTGD